ncbi:unnamed protein product [Rotaria magnacalcarata]|uniref:Uncharacterized protein n=3 Tax=Rotaria magnacalcarata TaxID=392030 RepID=A0A816ZMZ8_9BILA|nr:unnamed protein product [Rotaria magnacalcarata]
MWNHFDSIGERSRTNNHVEGWHRQLNARVRTHPDLWAWYNEAKSSEESVMIRHEQEQAQKRTTRPRKAKNIRDDEKLKLTIFRFSPGWNQTFEKPNSPSDRARRVLSGTSLGIPGTGR